MGKKIVRQGCFAYDAGLRLGEFDVQAALYSRLTGAGVHVLGELKCTIDGAMARLDLAVMQEDRRQVALAIEVKAARSARWKAAYKNSAQARLYSRLPFPCVMVSGHEEARAFADLLDEAKTWPAGIHYMHEFMA